MATTDSVLVNLKDLFEMETARRADEAVAKERAKHEAAARLEAERVAREKELEAARAQERMRAEAERIARDAELEARVRALRDELADVRAQREEMRTRVLDIATREPSKPSRGSWIAGAMAAMSLVAAITATAIAWPRETVVAQPRPAPEPLVVAVSEPVEPEEPVIAEPEQPAPVVVAANDPPRPRRCMTQRCRELRENRDRANTLAEQLNFEEGGEELIPED